VFDWWGGVLTLDKDMIQTVLDPNPSYIQISYTIIINPRMYYNS